MNSGKIAQFRLTRFAASVPTTRPRTSGQQFNARPNPL